MSTLSVFQSFKPVHNSGDETLIKSAQYPDQDTQAFCEAFFNGHQELHAYSEDEVIIKRFPVSSFVDVGENIILMNAYI
eukprot:75785-Pyramimonas_sp.AAC.1